MPWHWEDGTPALSIPPGLKRCHSAEGLTLGPHSPSHPARRGHQHRLGSRGRDGAPSARTEGRHSGTPGARGEPSQLQALRATRAASARGCHPACQAGRDCGQQSRLGTTGRDSQDRLQDRGHHPCQAAGHTGPQYVLPSWGRRALSSARDGGRAQPARSCTPSAVQGRAEPRALQSGRSRPGRAAEC